MIYIGLVSIRTRTARNLPISVIAEYLNGYDARRRRKL